MVYITGDQVINRAKVLVILRVLRERYQLRLEGALLQLGKAHGFSSMLNSVLSTLVPNLLPIIHRHSGAKGFLQIVVRYLSIVFLLFV